MSLDTGTVLQDISTVYWYSDHWYSVQASAHGALCPHWQPCSLAQLTPSKELMQHQSVCSWSCLVQQELGSSCHSTDTVLSPKGLHCALVWPLYLFAYLYLWLLRNNFISWIFTEFSFFLLKSLPSIKKAILYTLRGTAPHTLPNRSNIPKLFVVTYTWYCMSQKLVTENSGL